MLERVTGKRICWDEERGSKYARTSDESASIRAYSGKRTSVSPA
jgi:hypothetical protein